MEWLLPKKTDDNDPPMSASIEQTATATVTAALTADDPTNGAASKRSDKQAQAKLLDALTAEKLEEMLQDPSIFSFISHLISQKKKAVVSTVTSESTCKAATAISITAAEAGFASSTAIAEPPLPPTLTRKTRAKDLIPLDKRAFCYYKNGTLQGTGLKEVLHPRKQRAEQHYYQ